MTLNDVNNRRVERRGWDMSLGPGTGGAGEAEARFAGTLRPAGGKPNGMAYRAEPTAPVTEAVTVPAVLAAVLLSALTALPAVVAAPVTAPLAAVLAVATVFTAPAAAVPAVLAAVRLVSGAGLLA